MSDWYYKTNRKFYELHKCCFFKLGCTILIVLVQIFCNKKYNCPKIDEIDTSCSDIDSDIEESKNKKKRITKKKTNQTNIEMEKKKKTVSIEEDRHNETCILNQPQSKDPSFSKKKTLNWTDNYDNETLNVPPSFNLRPNQKSTPIRSCQQCKRTDSTDSENGQSKTNISQCNRNKNPNEVTIDIHTESNQDSGIHTADVHHKTKQNSDILSNDSFHSC